MEEGRPSRTAERVAERRAAHQVLDVPPVFVDPLAIRVIDPEAAERLERDPQSFNDSRIAPFLRAAFAVRSRFAEDELARAAARGVSQYVVLGAGFDTFAYRNPFADLTVFEVDHPATQALKRYRLDDAAIAIPPTVVFVSIDFAKESLRERLQNAGFDATRPAYFSWLGVVPYLERHEITETLAYIASLPAGTVVTFDYGSDPSSLSDIGKVVFERMAAAVAAAGEPWKTFFTPEDLNGLLRSAGFSAIEIHGRDELNARYFAGRTDGLRVGEMTRLAMATV
ncbi:MAG TPA: class I SAM-dependent methyltransferase [Thermoanaerobaculia bacterium]|nr:class I SAM-dependent methyltransferase [Thermoanaerobaculia bacterium]